MWEIRFSKVLEAGVYGLRRVQVLLLTRFRGRVEKAVLRVAGELGVVVHFGEFNVFKEVWEVGQDVHVRVVERQVFVRVAADGVEGLFQSFVIGEWGGVGWGDVGELVGRVERAGIGHGVGLRKYGSAKVSASDVWVWGDVLRSVTSGFPYCCLTWAGGGSLEDAAVAFGEDVGVTLGLCEGMSVLGIGGFGSWWIWGYLRRRFGCSVVGQLWGDELVAGFLGPGERDLRVGTDVVGSYDRVIWVEVSGGLAPGKVVEVIARSLTPSKGKAFVQLVGLTKRRAPATLDLIREYGFADILVSSAVELCDSVDGRLVLEDWKVGSTHYERTVAAWRNNLLQGWGEVSGRYGEECSRALLFHLCALEGVLKTRHLDLWRILLSK